jgi:subtilisin family serine protease
VKFGGTSAAAPEVANLAAKLFAINPKLTVAEVVKLIKDGADTSAADKRLKLINPRRSVEMLVSMKK